MSLDILSYEAFRRASHYGVAPYGVNCSYWNQFAAGGRTSLPACGFHDSNDFACQFQRPLGCTPRACRPVQSVKSSLD